MNEKRKRLLIELEDIIGHEFYNAKIQNWGPGGVFEGEGRELRYPVTFHDKNGKTIKTKNVDASLPAETIMTGVYKVGQNELSIMRALDRSSRTSNASTGRTSARVSHTRHQRDMANAHDGQVHEVPARCTSRIRGLSCSSTRRLRASSFSVAGMTLASGSLP